jgi:hypothetical protein
MYLSQRFSFSCLLALCLVGCGGRSAEGLPLETCVRGVWFNTPSWEPLPCAGSAPVAQVNDCAHYVLTIFKEGGEFSQGLVSFSARKRLVWAHAVFGGSWRVESSDSLWYSPHPGIDKTLPSAICTEEEIRAENITMFLRPGGTLADGILRSIEAGQKTVPY